jgi:hypothetical protein
MRIPDRAERPRNAVRGILSQKYNAWELAALEKPLGAQVGLIPFMMLPLSQWGSLSLKQALFSGGLRSTVRTELPRGGKAKEKVHRQGKHETKEKEPLGTCPDIRNLKA